MSFKGVVITTSLFVNISEGVSELDNSIWLRGHVSFSNKHNFWLNESSIPHCLYPSLHGSPWGFACLSKVR